ncbi:MAG: acylphosphatase [Planctomycetota bacterium]
MDRIARHIWVGGLVQGVAFRHFTKVRARELGVAGFVRNLPDGRVEVWAEGARAAVEDLVRWLDRGPPSAHVTEKHVEDAAPTGAERFEVRRP